MKTPTITKSNPQTDSEKLRTWTIQRFKDDLRTKKGYRLVSQFDITLNENDNPDTLYSQFEEKSTWMKLQKTYIEREHYFDRNNKFLERFDRPHYCSPSSESYWSM